MMQVLKTYFEKNPKDCISFCKLNNKPLLINLIHFIIVANIDDTEVFQFHLILANLFLQIQTLISLKKIATLQNYYQQYWNYDLELEACLKAFKKLRQRFSITRLDQTNILFCFTRLYLTISYFLVFLAISHIYSLISCNSYVS